MNERTAVATEAAPVTAEQDGVSRGRAPWILFLAERGIVVFTVVLIIGAAIFVNGFASLVNITDVLHRAAPVGIVAVGMTFVVISANYLDLSVVAQVATAAVILIGISNSHSILLAVLVALAVAALYGLLNGVAVGYFRANAVIVTLATTYVGLGILRWASGGSIFFGPKDGLIAQIGSFKLLGLPMSALVFFCVTVVLGFVLSRTTFGFLVRSIGSNKDATRLAGVNTSRAVVGAFLITALAATTAGFVLAAFSNTAVSTMATDFDFRALAAIIIGGNSVFGGKGSIFRTFLGVIFVSVLTNVLVLLNVSYGWQQIVIGTLIVLAVSVDAIARKVAAK